MARCGLGGRLAPIAGPSERADVRVVHLIGDMALGGAQRQLRALASQGAGEHVVVTWRCQPHPLAEGLRHEPLTKTQRLDPRFPARLRAHLRALCPDVVHAWLNPASAWAALASRGERWALLTSELVLRTPPAALWPHALADASVADSLAALRRLPSRRARYVAPGVGPAPEALARPERAPPSPFALVLGSVHPDKGQLHAVAAAARAGMPLALVGPVGDPAYLARVVAAGGRWFGPTQRPWDWLASAALVVLPSLTESAPNVVLEALALGKAVVASAVGDVPALLGAGRYGQLVAPGDEAALADALRAPPSPHAEAPAWVERRYGRERMLHDYAAVYAELFALRGRGGAP